MNFFQISSLTYYTDYVYSGLLLQASQAAFFTAINGRIKTLFLHRRRLVLLSFLFCVSTFSITQFATLLLLEDASCGVAVRFTLFFDQAARIAALSLIIWKVCDEARARTEAVVWVSIIVLRILMAGIMVGFTGMTFMPVCFPQPMHVVVGIVHTSFDGVVWVVLGWRIIGIWMLFVEQGRDGSGGGKSQGYGLFLIVLGFISWTIVSWRCFFGVKRADRFVGELSVYDQCGGKYLHQDDSVYPDTCAGTR